MSGVYIKGMEMPTSGTYEVSIDNSCGKDKTVMSLFVRGDGGIICCGCYEIVPVPAHGRLIDGDHLKHTHCAECTLYPDKCLEKTVDGCDWGSIIHLRMCPTIIPSDKEDV